MTSKEKRFNTFFMRVALLSAENSYANRAKVGAVLVKEGRIICNSWNGTPSGFPNSCEDLIDGKLVTKPEVVHAEANVITWAAKNGISTNGTDLYVTLSPCMSCAVLIIQAGIKRIYYAAEYRNKEAISFLKNHGIDVIRFPCKLK